MEMSVVLEDVGVVVVGEWLGVFTPAPDDSSQLHYVQPAASLCLRSGEEVKRSEEEEEEGSQQRCQ